MSTSEVEQKTYSHDFSDTVSVHANQTVFSNCIFYFVISWHDRLASIGLCNVNVIIIIIFFFAAVYPTASNSEFCFSCCKSDFPAGE